MIGGVVLAAGASRRFGGRKQLAPLDGRPLLEHVLEAMSRAPVDRTVVVLGAWAEQIARDIALHGAEPVACPRWRIGQAVSLQAGLWALGPDAEAAVIVVGDQPSLSPEAVRCVVDARAPDVLAVRATYAGRPGHPVLLERALFGAARRLKGDRGARGLLAGSPVREVPCDGMGDGDDVDTREQLEALRR